MVARSEAQLGSFLDGLVEEIAVRVADKLRGGHLAGYVDQSDSPLGRRRHIEAVRSRALPGVKVGRRYLVRAEDLERFVAQRSDTAVRVTVKDPVDQLAAELGHKRRR